MGNYIDSEGNTVEAFTPEEVEEKLAEAKEEATTAAKIEIDNLNSTLAERADELEILKKDLEAEKKKDKNFGGQRKIIEEKSAAIEELQKKMDNLQKTMEDRISTLAGKEKETIINGMIADLAGTNQELKDKIRFFYDSFKALEETGKTKEQIDKEISERINNAYQLAAGSMPKVQFAGPIISGAGGSPVINPTGEKLSGDLQELAGKMGIKPEELKKHKLI